MVSITSRQLFRLPSLLISFNCLKYQVKLPMEQTVEFIPGPANHGVRQR